MDANSGIPWHLLSPDELQRFGTMGADERQSQMQFWTTHGIGPNAPPQVLARSISAPPLPVLPAGTLPTQPAIDPSLECNGFVAIPAADYNALNGRLEKLEAAVEEGNRKRTSTMREDDDADNADNEDIDDKPKKRRKNTSKRILSQTKNELTGEQKSARKMLEVSFESHCVLLRI